MTQYIPDYRSVNLTGRHIVLEALTALIEYAVLIDDKKLAMECVQKIKVQLRQPPNE